MFRTLALLSGFFAASHPALAQTATSSSQPEPTPHAAQPVEPHNELDRALADAGDHRDAMRFLIDHMPPRDKQALSAEFLIENLRLAHEARAAAPWGNSIPDDVFLDAVLPYANVSEPRDPWRADFRARFTPLVEDAPCSGEAALRLNAAVFDQLGVRYSTERERADQSPAESIAQGKASCTGLSIILVDACRAVGVPARLAGTPNWHNDRGNHTWVEVFDTADQRWHFLGAAEPSAHGLDHAWFTDDAAKADPDSAEHAIYAVTWRKTGATLPMVWAPDADPVNAENVTARYLRAEPAAAAGLVRHGVRVRLAESGRRIAVPVRAVRTDTAEVLTGMTRADSADTNDILWFNLPEGVEVRTEAPGAPAVPMVVAGEETVIDIEVKRGACIDALLAWRFEGQPAQDILAGVDPAILQGASTEVLAATRLAAFRAWREHRAASGTKGTDGEARIVRTQTHESPYTIKTVGLMPEGGWPVVIAMHGGGGAPAEVNDSQWRHMQVYYHDHPAPPPGGGYLYCALRAPTNDWNGFYTDYIYPVIENLIAQLDETHGIDLNRVYLIGYSHGGYGAFAIGPKMADRFAAVHASAAAPTDGETSAVSLRNLRFTCMIGENDTAYGRIDRCRAFAEEIRVLREAHPGAYPVEVWEKQGFGHGGLPDRDILPELLQHTRNAAPRDLSWVQTDPVVRHHFWLEDAAPARGRRIDATCHDNTITLTSDTIDRITLNLDERHIDMSKPVKVVANGREHVLTPAPSLEALAVSILERRDPDLAALWSIEIDLRP